MLCNTVVQGTKQEIEAIIKLAEDEFSGICATLLSCLKAIGKFDDGLEKKFSTLASRISKSFAELECKAVFIDHDYNSEKDDELFEVNEFTLEKNGYSMRTHWSSKI